MTFIEWLHTQAKNDTEAGVMQPFSGLYEFGPYFARTIGHKKPDPIAFTAHLKLEEVSEDMQLELLRQLVIAEATWQTDDPEAFSRAPSYSDETEPEPVSTTAIAPAPALRPNICGFRDLDGTFCKDYAVDGAARCVAHGGGITDPSIRASLLLLAYAQLTKGTKTAVETLINVMETSTNDLARVNAAKELLDRAGLSVDQHVTVTQGAAATDTRADALARIAAHLDLTKSRLLPPPPDDDEIVDAEIVEDDEVGAA